MQDKSPRKPQYIDGFVHNRQRRSVVYSREHTLNSGGVDHNGVKRFNSGEHQPIGDFRPRASAAAQHASAQQSQTQPQAESSSLNRLRHGRRSAGEQVRTAKKQMPKWRRLTKRGALAVLVLFVVAGGWLGWKVYNNMAKVFGSNNPLHVLSAFKPVPLKGQDKGRVNILLAGNSSDAADHGGASLTDSIMLLSINTHDNSAFMLSVPRDLWVNVPNQGYGKINTTGAVTNFNEAGYPKGSMGALEKTLSQTLGINVNYYALVNYSAFKEAVDSVGGINVNIQSQDARGIYDPSFRPHEGGALKLPNGNNHLSGQVALNLARARGDPFNGVYGAYGFPQSDFDRTKHQRQMMLALKEKAMSAKVISNPMKVGDLMDSVGNNVHTDFQPNELASLHYLMKKIKSSDIQSLSLNSADGKNLLVNYTAPGGQSALAPAAGPEDFSAIQAYIAKMLTNSKVAKEGATVAILNGGQVVGLAKQEGDALAKKGLTVAAVGDAPQPSTDTVIIDNSGNKKPASKQLLKKQYGNKTSTDLSIAQQHNADFVVIIGNNYKTSTTTASAQ